MDLTNLLSLLSTIVVVVGWYTVYRFTAANDRKSKNREIRYSYLSKAHKSISAIAHRNGNYTEQQKSDFEEAIENIQIFGTKDQIETLRNVLSSDEKDFNKVLLSLRNEMRKSLDLETNNAVLFYRID